MIKVCTKCNRELPGTTFYFFRHKKMKDGLNSACKECEGHRFKEPRKIPTSEKENYKICSKCHRELPETSEYFFKRKNGKNGLNSCCKECSGWSYGQKKVTGTEKKCYSCKRTLPLTNEFFSKCKRSFSGFNVACKECVRNHGRTYYKNNKDEVDKKHREYYQANKEQTRIRGKKYRTRNRDKISVKWHLKQAKIKKLPRNFNTKQWRECKKHFDYKCAYCGEKKPLEQEHFIPLNKGGEYTVQNIIPACKSCNSSKQDKDFSEWYNQRESYSVEREKKILDYLGYHNNMQQMTLI